MGIENCRLGWQWYSTTGPLITPHGDRKRVKYCLEVPQPLYLITPHGDRKHRADRVPEALAVVADSLPLMGIENAVPGRTVPRWCGISLPLMGIENPRTLLMVSVHADPHYPSWGSKTSLLP